MISARTAYRATGPGFPWIVAPAGSPPSARATSLGSIGSWVFPVTMMRGSVDSLRGVSLMTPPDLVTPDLRVWAEIKRDRTGSFRPRFTHSIVSRPLNQTVAASSPHLVGDPPVLLR